MWISRQAWNEMHERLKNIEARLREAERGPRIYADKGKIHTWSGGSYLLIEAVNQIAEHVGLQWEQQPEIKAKLECSPVGKTGDDHG